MTAVAFGALICAAAALLAGVLVGWVNSTPLSVRGAIAGATLALVGVVAAHLIYHTQVRYGRVACVRWGVESQHATRYEYLGAWSWECFAQTGDGKWLPKDQLRDVAP